MPTEPSVVDQVEALLGSLRVTDLRLAEREAGIAHDYLAKLRTLEREAAAFVEIEAEYPFFCRHREHREGPDRNCGRCEDCVALSAIERAKEQGDG